MLKKLSFTLQKVVLLFPFLVVAVCNAETNDADKVAEQFIEAYYVTNSVKSAVDFTAGSAKEKLDKELASIEAAGVSEADVDKPKYETEMISTERSSGTQAQVKWKVTAVSFKTIFVTMMLENQNNEGWKVTSFKESNE